MIFESNGAKRAHAMAEFARSAVPPQLRIATPAELTDATLAAEEEELASDDREATRRP